MAQYRVAYCSASGCDCEGMLPRNSLQLVQAAQNINPCTILTCRMCLSSQAENLKGSDRTTHPFARLMLAGECLHTSVMWQTTHPNWEEKIVFKCEPPSGPCKKHSDLHSCI